MMDTNGVNKRRYANDGPTWTVVHVALKPLSLVGNNVMRTGFSPFGWGPGEDGVAVLRPSSTGR